MRNLIQYPVTFEEKVELLKRLRNDFLAEQRIGDMRPVLLDVILQDVESWKWYEEYLERKELEGCD